MRDALIAWVFGLTFCLLGLFLHGCGTDGLPGITPVIPVHYCEGTPDEDVRLWQLAMDEWETQVGAELFEEQPGERPAGTCGLTVCARPADGDLRAEYEGDGCTPRIWYEPDTLFVTRQHELGHALGLDHAPGGTMEQGHATQNVVTAEDAERVKARWGL